MLRSIANLLRLWADRIAPREPEPPVMAFYGPLTVKVCGDWGAHEHHLHLPVGGTVTVRSTKRREPEPDVMSYAEFCQRLKDERDREVRYEFRPRLRRVK